MGVHEIGYYYAGGKNISRIYDCLKAIELTHKDEKFFERIRERFKELQFVDAWGGVGPTLGLLLNWGLMSQKGLSKISYTTISEEDPFILTDEGKMFLTLDKSQRQEFILKHALEDGLLGMLELVHERNVHKERCTLKWLKENWNEKVGLPSGKWSSDYSRGQNVETRRSWAKEFGLVNEMGRPIYFYLTEKGVDVLKKYGGKDYAEIPIIAERERKIEKEEYSHSDTISDLLEIGKILGFTTLRTPSVNDLLPREKWMKHKIKQLDCAWYIHHPFTGNIWVPIEVQKGGSIEDALFRLSVVLDQSHRLVMVCDESDKEIILEMARRQRIPVEKLVFFTFDEIKQIKEAIEKVDEMKNKLLGSIKS